VNTLHKEYKIKISLLTGNLLYYLIFLSYFYRFFIIHEYTKEKSALQTFLHKKKRKVINKKLGEAKKKSYIGRNIKNEKKCIKT